MCCNIAWLQFVYENLVIGQQLTYKMKKNMPCNGPEDRLMGDCSSEQRYGACVACIHEDMFTAKFTNRNTEVGEGTDRVGQQCENTLSGCMHTASGLVSQTPNGPCVDRSEPLFPPFFFEAPFFRFLSALLVNLSSSNSSPETQVLHRFRERKEEVVRTMERAWVDLTILTGLGSEATEKKERENSHKKQRPKEPLYWLTNDSLASNGSTNDFALPIATRIQRPFTNANSYHQRGFVSTR